MNDILLTKQMFIIKFLKSVVECLHVTTMVPEINDFPICLLCVHIFAYFFRAHFFQWVSHLHYNFFNRFPTENPPKPFKILTYMLFVTFLFSFKLDLKSFTARKKIMVIFFRIYSPYFSIVFTFIPKMSIKHVGRK